MKETIDVYTTRPGFICEESREDLGSALLYRDDVEGTVALPSEHTPLDEPLFAGSLYITTDDVDNLWSQLKGKARICYALEEFDYGMKEFALHHNNGYLIQFGQGIVTTPSQAPEEPVRRVIAIPAPSRIPFRGHHFQIRIFEGVKRFKEIYPGMCRPSSLEESRFLNPAPKRDP